ncbi:MAG TPA: pitrilysin family protein [Anaeromyxobacteraceae bacterium]|nr:pitrilysin family protein [Anaeromyxobacteraceae bacterium]
MRTRPLPLAAAALLLACAGAQKPEPAPAPAAAEATPDKTASRSGQPVLTPARPDEAAQAQAKAAAEAERQVPVPGPAPELKVPPQRHFQLSNGLKVRLVEYHRLPIVALHLVVDAGGVYDPAGKEGLASFTAGMMTEGTKTRSATKISDDLGFLGASLGAGAGFDSASLSGSSLTRNLDGLLDIFADVLVNPTFPQADFARVQDQRLVALVQQRDQPGAQAAKAFARLYWGDHPYGHWLMGTEASLKKTTRADLARYHAARWKPKGSELVVVGDIGEGDLKPKLERALARWQGAVPPPARPAVAKAATLRTVLIQKRGPSPQAFVMMGMPGFQRSSPDYVPAEVAFQVLGGGTASRLFRNLREKEGYTYGIYARSEARKLGGTSFVVGSVKSDVTGKALQAILGEIAQLRDAPVPDAELAVARNGILLSLPGDFATAGGIAAKVAEEVVHGLPDDYWDDYAKQIEKVSPGDVQEVARKYLDPAKLTTVMVCDPAEVKPQLEALPLGAVEVRPAGPPPAKPGKPAAPAPAPARASR